MEITTSISLLFLLLFSAFFSASETALMSLDKIKLKNKVNKGEKNAQLIENLLDHPDRLLSSILIGNNIVNILASALATTLFTTLFGSGGIAAATLVMTVLVLIFGEVTPKSIASRYPFRVSRLFVRPIALIVQILTPFAWILSHVTGGILKLFGLTEQTSKGTITEEEVRLMVNLSEETGMLKEYEKTMIQNIFEFDDIEVEEVMIPRMYMTALPSSASFEEIRQCILEHQFSRIPVYEETLDNIIGVLYVKDLFAISEEAMENFELTTYLRPPFFVPHSMTLDSLLKEMKNRKVHLAIIVDEYGGTSGMTTMEDLIEEVFGEIEDEYDMEEEEIKKLSNNVYLIDSRMRINVLNELLELQLPDENVSSIGGFILEHLGRLPTLKQKILYENLIFIVEEMERRRIKKLKLIVKQEDPDA